MVVIKLSAICAGVESSKRRDHVTCSGIAAFNEKGKLLLEIMGGKLEWRASENDKSRVKRLIQNCVQGDLKRTANIEYHVDFEHIFIMTVAAYKATVERAEFVPE